MRKKRLGSRVRPTLNQFSQMFPRMNLALSKSYFSGKERQARVSDTKQQSSRRVMAWSPRRRTQSSGTPHWTQYSPMRCIMRTSSILAR